MHHTASVLLCTCVVLIAAIALAKAFVALRQVHNAHGKANSTSDKRQ
jgi:hypothetical protein